MEKPISIADIIARHGAPPFVIGPSDIRCALGFAASALRDAGFTVTESPEGITVTAPAKESE